jgi:hypothetical protein
MTFAPRLLPLALTLLSALLSLSIHPAHAAGGGSRELSSAAAVPLSATPTLASQYLSPGIRQSDADYGARHVSSDGRRLTLQARDIHDGRFGGAVSKEADTDRHDANQA